MRHADIARKTAGKGSHKRWLPTAMLKAALLGIDSDGATSHKVITYLHGMFITGFAISTLIYFFIDVDSQNHES